MRNDDVVEELKPLPHNAEVMISVVDNYGFERDYIMHGIEYNAHTNTIHVRGL